MFGTRRLWVKCITKTEYVRCMHASCPSNIPSPTIVYKDNHLLVVNKPPGWHSVPNAGPVTLTTTPGPSSISNKCLLTYLQSVKLGGGSQQDFLKPLHRIDQPCSGLIILGKTSKAASRVTKQWKAGLVQKEYLCVVATDRLPSLLNASHFRENGIIGSNNLDGGNSVSFDDINSWYQLKGLLRPKELQANKSKKRRNRSTTKRSVTVLPIQENHAATSTLYKEIGLFWKVMPRQQFEDVDCQYTIIRVRTNQGARHMVRALLSHIGGCPILGDVRYGDHITNQPLSDRSVALHAWRIKFVDPKFKLGILTGNVEFEAPIPTTWETYFSIRRE
jgi:23S rRNA-/tRNA-specific pseudouridylate synthase